MVEAELTALPGSIVRIKFKKAFSYLPGQYCFFMIRELGRFEYHPFSLSSAPHEEFSTVHVRAMGDWTTRLLEMAREKGGNASKVSTFVEGPYGRSKVDLDDPSYKVQLNYFMLMEHQ